jgi:hypothetical protein
VPTEPTQTPTPTPTEVPEEPSNDIVVKDIIFDIPSSTESASDGKSNGLYLSFARASVVLPTWGDLVDFLKDYCDDGQAVVTINPGSSSEDDVGIKWTLVDSQVNRDAYEAWLNGDLTEDCQLEVELNLPDGYVLETDAYQSCWAYIHVNN